jgi:hypothetical protein
MTPLRAVALPASVLVLLLAGCQVPVADPDPEDSTAITEVGEIGVLTEMTPSECAVAGSPWRLDDTQFDRDYSEAMMAGFPEARASGIVGDYSIDFDADGRVRVETNGYHVETTLQTLDDEETDLFQHVTVTALAAIDSAEWGDVDTAGTIVFHDWTSDIVQGPPVYDDGSPYTGPLPAWLLSGRTGVTLECVATDTGFGLWLRSTTPGYLDLLFVR